SKKVRQPEKVIFGLKGLKLTTPKAMKRLGIALAASGTAGAGICYIMEYERIALLCLVMTVIGTFISQMFGETQ
ncbi:MAG: hypothetical protein ACKODS_05225, partial [Methylophilaceae bacterium]